MGNVQLQPVGAPIALPPVLAYIVGAPVAPRASVERLIQRAIEALDELDGDPDAEDACDLEDDFTFSDVTRRYFMPTGPGCPIADSGGDEHDGCEPEEDRDPDLYRIAPKYGEDQSLGPLNEIAAHRDQMLHERSSYVRGAP